MREILFRGKQVYSGEWLYGMPDNEDCSADFPCISPSRNYHTKDTFPLDWEVDPETVGQFTGLTDKNGKKIFEGDICRNTRNGEIVLVKWHGTMAGYVWRKHGESHLSDFGELFRAYDKYEVIGNIHDNPELLEA